MVDTCDGYLIVGGDGGAFHYTRDSGVSWTEITYLGSGAGAIVHDVQFSPQSQTLGFAAIEIGGVGYIYRTTDAGNHWFRTEPSVAGITANDRLRFVDVCPQNANIAVTGGLADGTTDGILFVGE